MAPGLIVSDSGQKYFRSVTFPVGIDCDGSEGLGCPSRASSFPAAGENHPHHVYLTFCLHRDSPSDN